MGKETVWEVRGWKSKMSKKKYGFLSRSLFLSPTSLTSSASLTELENKGISWGWQPRTHPHPSLFRIWQVQAFCMTEFHLLTFFGLPATAPQPQVFGKSWSEERERSEAHLSVLLTMWFHYFDYEAYSNRQSKAPCPWDPQF